MPIRENPHGTKVESDLTPAPLFVQRKWRWKWRRRWRTIGAGRATRRTCRRPPLRVLDAPRGSCRPSRRGPLRSGSGTHWLPKTRAQRGHGFKRPQSSSTVASVGSPGSCRWSRPPPSGGNLQSIGIGSPRTVGSPGNVQRTGSGGKPDRIYRRCVWRRSPQGRCLN